VGGRDFFYERDSRRLRARGMRDGSGVDAATVDAVIRHRADIGVHALMSLPTRAHNWPKAYSDLHPADPSADILSDIRRAIARPFLPRARDAGCPSARQEEGASGGHISEQGAYIPRERRPRDVTAAAAGAGAGAGEGGGAFHLICNSSGSRARRGGRTGSRRTYIRYVRIELTGRVGAGRGRERESRGAGRRELKVATVLRVSGGVKTQSPRVAAHRGWRTN